MNMVTNHCAAKHYGMLKRTGRRRGETETALFLTAAFERVSTANTDATVKACVDAMRRVYDRHATSKTRPYDGVRELLDDLARRQVRVSVLSNKPHSLTVEVVREVLGDWTMAA